MASSLSTDGKNAILDSDSTWPPAYVSLHTDNPGTTGDYEVTGGTPAYARMAATWDAASSGSKALSASITFDVPSGTTVAYVGMWTASTSGTYLGCFDVVNETFGGQGTYTISSGSISL